MTAILNDNALRVALYRAFNASVDEPCPAVHAAFDRLVATQWVSLHNMLETFSYREFDVRYWLGVSCGYYSPETMNVDFKRLTGKTRDEWLALAGWT